MKRINEAIQTRKTKHFRGQRLKPDPASARVTRVRIVALALAVLVHFSCQVAHAQNFDWIRTFPGEPERRTGNGVLVDSFGDIVVAGTRFSADDSSRNVLVSKYDSEGNEIWNRIWGSDCCREQGLDVGTDADGNLYVSAETWYEGEDPFDLPDAVLLKYDRDGELVDELFFGEDNIDDRFRPLEVDAAGTTYALGITKGVLGEQAVNAPNAFDLFLTRINPNGSEQWTVQFERGSSPHILALSPNGGGLTKSAEGLLMFRSDGTIEPLGYGDRMLRDISFDSDGNIYLLEREVDDAGSPTHGTVTKLDRSGETQMWERTFAVSTNTLVYDFEIVADGTVLVTGNAHSGDSSEASGFVVKLDSEGELSWITEFDRRGRDGGRYITSDQSNGIIVLATTDCDYSVADCGEDYRRIMLARLTNGDVALGDFDFDGNLSTLDADFLSQSIQEGSVNSFYDLNGDELVTSEDLHIWATELKGTLLGDVDLDFKVDFTDFLTLSSNFGGEGNWSAGDFDTDGTVGFPDFLLLSENFGSDLATVSVPEPPSIVTILVCIGCLFQGRKHLLGSEVSSLAVPRHVHAKLLGWQIGTRPAWNRPGDFFLARPPATSEFAFGSE